MSKDQPVVRCKGKYCKTNNSVLSYFRVWCNVQGYAASKIVLKLAHISVTISCMSSIVKSASPVVVSHLIFIILIVKLIKSDVFFF